ncbi:hypothetical protein [Bordetella genomosp. 1]|uniref:HTH cro/C1-type domain-containing protein n=1 Tax=Bordetella genomosp. 1 TaxID=1395607 RepID=A0ABX4EWG5_9BORD|nr:hypothetical protein [Bordetella genomosp. 1]OZI58723.1 hypothetical protein CAL27_18755 [Bordetella genomosp. 1]
MADTNYMARVFETRRDNLRSLAQKSNGPAALARRLGITNTSYLSQLIGKQPTRNISETTARKIEAELGLSAGWLDVPRVAP